MAVARATAFSHNKIEDTREKHLALAVTAFDKFADNPIAWMRGRNDE